MKKLLLSILLALVILPSTVNAQQNVSYVKTLLPTIDSLWELGTTTKAFFRIFTDELCLAGDCKTAWPVGGGGGVSGGTAGMLASWVNSTSLTATGSPTVGYLTATSSTATSTLAGGLTIDDTTLVVDYSSNKVGIGLDKFFSYLTVNGLGVIGSANSPNFDIGTGRIGVGSSLYSYGSICTNNSAASCGGANGVVIGGVNTGAYTNITSSGDSFFGGNVGVGTTTPGTALGVNGAGVFTGQVTAPNFYATSTTATSTFQDLIISQNRRLSLSTDQNTQTNASLIDLDFTTNSAKANIAFRASSTKPVVWLQAHDCLDTGCTDRHQHFSIETKNRTNDTLDSRFDCAWGRDDNDNDAECGVRSGYDFELGSGSNLHIIDGEVQHGSAFTLYPNYDLGNTTIGLRVATSSTGDLVISGNGTNVLEIGDDLDITGTTVTHIGTTYNLDSTGTATFRADRAATTNFAQFTVTTAGTDQWTFGLRNDSTNNFHFRDNVNGRTPLTIIQSTGNVGIATSTPGTALGVTGDVLATGRVTATHFYGTSTTATSTFNAPISATRGTFGTFSVTGLASCDTIDTDATGNFRCGTDAEGVGGSGTNYFTSSGANTILNTGSNVQAPTFEATSTTATSTLPSLLATYFRLGADTINDLTGSGITVSGGALTLDRTGAWTGTFDGQEGTYYLSRANHTGTQTASTISDFDTEVSNNADVSANTSARHSAVTVTGEDYASLSTQQITFNAIDPDNLSASDFGGFTCNGTTCSIDEDLTASSTLHVDNNVFSGLNRFSNTGTTTFAGGINLSGIDIDTWLTLGTDSILDLTGTGLTVTNNALTLDATGNWTGTFDGLEGSAYEVDLTFDDGLTRTANEIDFTCTEVEGTGINCSSNDITLDATGDWTGTLDGIQGASFLRSDTSDNFTSGTLSFDSGTTVRFNNTSTTSFSGGILSSTGLSANYIDVGYIHATSTATSTFVGGLDFTRFKTSATSTGSSGINLTGGCFSINGVCIGGGTGGSSQWTTNSNDIYYNTGNVGIGTTTPYAKLAVTGEVVANNFTATSTTATSTFKGTVYVGDSARTNATSTITLGDVQNSLVGCINMIRNTGSGYATSSFYINQAGTALVVEANACR